MSEPLILEETVGPENGKLFWSLCLPGAGDVIADFSDHLSPDEQEAMAKEIVTALHTAAANDDLMDTAMCLWKAVLDLEDEITGTTFHVAGYAAVRTAIRGFAADCDADYRAARAAGYDGCFDWQFVPAWLAANVAFDPEGVRRIVPAGAEAA